MNAIPLHSFVRHRLLLLFIAKLARDLRLRKSTERSTDFSGIQMAHIYKCFIYLHPCSSITFTSI